MKLILLIATFAISLNSFAQTPGSLDPQFGNSGKVILSINNGADKATGVVMQPDNKILVSA